jgi:two-component system phosphate regulon response regulator PhoB
MRVLIIEDDDSNRRILTMTIEQMGLEVHTAENGEEGLEIAKEMQPHLIIMDVMMPKMGGIQTVKLIRNSGSLSKVPIIIVSAKAAKKDAQEALDVGANEFVTKPFRVKIIQDIVKKYLELD